MNQFIYSKELTLIRPEETFKAGLCLCDCSKFARYEEIVAFLHPQEKKYYETLRFEKRIKSYLIGRLTAKKAIACLIRNDNLATISIQAGIFNQPVVSCPDRQNIQVSISHCDNFGAAIAFLEIHPMAIDVERIINGEHSRAIERESTESEIKLIKRLPFSYVAMLTILWTAKEALSKVLKTGMMTSFKIFEIDRIEINSDYALCFYKNFAQYKTIAFFINDYICSIIYPMKTELNLDFHSLKKNLSECP